MSARELRKMIELASKQCEKIFRITEEIAPMYHAIKRDGDALFFEAPGGSKDESVAMVRAAFELHDVVRYILINEAWVVEFTKLPSATELERWDQLGLSGHPDRREVLLFHGEDEASGEMRAQRYILRPEHGRATLTPLEFIDDTGGVSEGRLVGLLPHPARGKMS